MERNREQNDKRDNEKEKCTINLYRFNLTIEHTLVLECILLKFSSKLILSFSQDMPTNLFTTKQEILHMLISKPNKDFNELISRIKQSFYQVDLRNQTEFFKG